jgi:hypothetical protein
MLPSEASLELVIKKIRSMLSNNMTAEAIVDEPSLYVYNIEHPDLITPEKIRFLVNILINNQDVSYDEIHSCMKEFNLIVTKQIVMTDMTSQSTNVSSPYAKIINLISDEEYNIISIPHSVKVITNNSDVKTDINNINMKDDIININFNMIMDIKKALVHNLFTNDKYHKFNYLCGRFVMNGSYDEYIDSIVTVGKISQRLPYAVKIKSIGLYGKAQHDIFIDILQDVDMTKISHLTLMRIYTLLLSTNYHVYIDRLIESLYEFKIRSFTPSKGVLSIEWNEYNTEIEYIVCQHKIDLDKSLRPSPTMIEDLTKFINTYGRLVGSSYHCSICGEDLSAIFLIADNSIRILDKRLSASSITNMFNHEPYKTYSSSFGYVMLQISSIDNAVHVNARSSGYNATKYTLDWLLMLNDNIRDFETNYKKEISMGIFFCRLSQDLFSLTYSEKERFGLAKQINLRILILVAIILSSSMDVLYQLIMSMKLKDSNIEDLILRLTTRLKMKHDNIHVLVEFYLRPTIVLDRDRLTYVDKQIRFLSNNNIVRPIIRITNPVITAVDNIDLSIIHNLICNIPKICVEYDIISGDHYKTEISTTDLVLPKMSLTQAETLVKKYSESVTFRLIVNDVTIDNYSTTLIDDIEYITISYNQVIITHLVENLIKSNNYKVEGNEFYNLLRMGDQCPYSSVQYQYNVNARYLTISNFCSRYQPNIDYDKIMIMVNNYKSDESTRLMMYNLLCLSIVNNNILVKDTSSNSSQNPNNIRGGKTYSRK